MTTSNILQSIMDWNPWLEGEMPSELIGYKRNYNLLSLLEMQEIKILEGARRVGKSTLIYQAINNVLLKHQQVLYINFDDSELSKYSLKEIFYDFLQYKQVDCLFIDEIQHCQDWVHFIRQLYDTKKLKQIWITGSKSSLVKKEYKTLLTGRNITLQIHPLSFSEYLTFNNESNQKTPMSSAKEAQIKSYFNEYFHYGAFPAVVLQKYHYKELLINYFEDIIYKDIVARYEVNPVKIKEAGLYLATNSTKNFSYRSLASALNIHPNTAKDYLNYFTEVFLFSELYRFDYSVKKQITDKKVYILDTGLAAANSFRFSENQGRMLENLVYCELKRRKKEIYFFKQKKECDFVVKDNLEIVSLIQVCFQFQDNDTKKREIDGLKEAMVYFNLNHGHILTMNDSDSINFLCNDEIYKITILPVWKWLLHTS